MMKVACCGRTMTPDEALAHVRDRDNRCQWTYELLAAMLSAQTSHPSHQDGTRISTTVLTSKCLRRLVFERQTDYVVPLENLWPMFRGTQFHGQLEAYAGPDTYAEARFYVHDLGMQIPAVRKALPGSTDRSFSGSPDLVSVEAGILYDYKRTKEVPRYNYVYADHVEQLNINRWLVDYADSVEVSDGYGEAILYDLATERSRFQPPEWQSLVIVYVDDKGPKPLTVTESSEVVGKNGRPKRVRHADIWSDEKVEALIARRYVAARRALLAGEAPIPDGWEHQSHPLCVSCAHRKMCGALEKEGH